MMCFVINQFIFKSPMKPVAPVNGRKPFSPADEIICELRSHWDLHAHLCIIWEERRGEPTAGDSILGTPSGSLELSSENITELRDTIVKGGLSNDDAATRAEKLNQGGRYRWEVENAVQQEHVFLDAVDTMLRAIDDGYYVYYTSCW